MRPQLCCLRHALQKPGSALLCQSVLTKKHRISMLQKPGDHLCAVGSPGTLRSTRNIYFTKKCYAYISTRMTYTRRCLLIPSRPGSPGPTGPESPESQKTNSYVACCAVLKLLVRLCPFPTCSVLLKVCRIWELSNGGYAPPYATAC